MIDYIPLNYDQLNLVQGGYTPSCIKGRNNKAFSFGVDLFFSALVL